MLLAFDKIWRAPDEIARLASLAVCARENEDWDALREKAAALKDSLGATVELVQGDSLTISSTELRQGGALRCYTPESVADYIEERICTAIKPVTYRFDGSIQAFGTAHGPFLLCRGRDCGFAGQELQRKAGKSYVM